MLPRWQLICVTCEFRFARAAAHLQACQGVVTRACSVPGRVPLARCHRSSSGLRCLPALAGPRRAEGRGRRWRGPRELARAAANGRGAARVTLAVRGRAVTGVGWLKGGSARARAGRGQDSRIRQGARGQRRQQAKGGEVAATQAVWCVCGGGGAMAHACLCACVLWRYSMHGCTCCWVCGACACMHAYGHEVGGDE